MPGKTPKQPRTGLRALERSTIVREEIDDHPVDVNPQLLQQHIREEIALHRKARETLHKTKASALPGGRRRKTRRIRGGVGKHAPQPFTGVTRSQRAVVVRRALDAADMPADPKELRQDIDKGLREARMRREAPREVMAATLSGGSKRKSRKNRS